MNLLAHITEKNGQRINQTLKAHSYKVAEYASDKLKDINFENVAFLAGMLHDMGKATRKYNDYLEKAYNGEKVVRGSVNHTFAGTIYILENYHDKSDQWAWLTSEIIAYVIGSHHGLFDCVDFEGRNGFFYRLEKDRNEICYEEAIDNFFKKIFEEKEVEHYFRGAKREIESHYAKMQDGSVDSNQIFFQVGLLVRLVLSTIIYADHRDTAEFMAQGAYPDIIFDWNKQLQYMENKLNQFQTDSEINKVRTDISFQSAESAKRQTGIYRMNVPTGAGKTLSSLRYALTHAKISEHNKKRIIFVIPLLSVLDQNAKIIQEYISDREMVLEHHSNVINEGRCGKNNDGEELDTYELILDNWESPIIITTMVQLLNVLFLAKTSAIKRMQSLSDSIIVIDEIQTLPHKVIVMFNAAMNFLSQHCNTTIVLSSATQPCFEEIEWPINLEEKPDIVSLTEYQKKQFDRCDILDKTNPYGMDLDECGSFIEDLMKRHNALLVICNTKKEAKELHEIIVKLITDKSCSIFHLSTSICQSHRSVILKEIQNKLDIIQKCEREGNCTEKIICISTQLVEAGIDFSFNGVVRFLAGIDNIAQAAGRCNRSNEYSQKGKVYLINIKGEDEKALKMLPEIKLAKKSTRRVLNYFKNRDRNLISYDVTRQFYKFLFEEKELKEKMRYPVQNENELYLKDLLGNTVRFTAFNRKQNQEFLLHQPFKTVGKKFCVFENETYDIIVPYEDGKELIRKLEELDGKSGYFFCKEYDEFNQLLRKAKLYTVSVFKYELDKLWSLGDIKELFEGKILILREDAYDSEYYGLQVKEKEVGSFIL